MFVIVRENDETCYLKREKNSSFSATTNFEEALITTFNKATNILNSSLSKKDKKKWKLKELEDDGYFKKSLEFDELDFSYEVVNVDEELHSIEASLKNLFSYKKSMETELAHIELELCDCVHACEFFKCDAAKGYGLYKLIHDRRVRRRFLKNELEKVNSILLTPNKEIADGVLRKKFVEINNRFYKPRVLQELFQQGERKV